MSDRVGDVSASPARYLPARARLPPGASHEPNVAPDLMSFPAIPRLLLRGGTAR